MMNVLSPCFAGLDPASHSVKQVGTQRVALDRDSMGLRVKPARTQAHFDTPPLFFSVCGYNLAISLSFHNRPLFSLIESLVTHLRPFDIHLFVIVFYKPTNDA